MRHPRKERDGCGRLFVNQGDGLGDIWWNWVVLAAWGAAGYIISLRVFRWQ